MSLSTSIQWAPRVLGIAYVFFLASFSLDVFNEGLGVVETALALFMHLVPTFLVILALAVAWRWPGEGGLLYVLLGVGLLFFIAGPGPFRLLQMSAAVYLIVAGPVYLIGLLFFLSSRLGPKPRRRY